MSYRSELLACPLVPGEFIYSRAIRNALFLLFRLSPLQQASVLTKTKLVFAQVCSAGSIRRTLMKSLSRRRNGLSRQKRLWLSSRYQAKTVGDGGLTKGYQTVCPTPRWYPGVGNGEIRREGILPGHSGNRAKG